MKISFKKTFRFAAIAAAGLFLQACASSGGLGGIGSVAAKAPTIKVPFYCKALGVAGAGTDLFGLVSGNKEVTEKSKATIEARKAECDKIVRLRAEQLALDGNLVRDASQEKRTVRSKRVQACYDSGHSYQFCENQERAAENAEQRSRLIKDCVVGQRKTTAECARIVDGS